MTASAAPSTATPISITPLSSLEAALNKIFLAVGDFLEFNTRSSSLGLDHFSRKPHGESRRALDANLEAFHSACDTLEIQIIRAKQVLRREIELIKHPPSAPEPDKPEEAVEPEPEVQEIKMEEVLGDMTAMEGEQSAVEQPEKEEDLGDDLFTSEFDSFLDPSGYGPDLGFGTNMDWMNDV